MTSSELEKLLAEEDPQSDAMTEEKSSPKHVATTVANILHVFPDAGREAAEPDRRAQSKAKAREEKAEFKKRLKLAQDQLANATCPDPDGPMFGTPEYQAWKLAEFGARSVSAKLPRQRKTKIPQTATPAEEPA